MPLIPFLLYSTIGIAAWVALLTYAGYILGDNYDKVKQFIAPIATVIVASLIFAAILWVIKRKRNIY